MPTIQLDGLKPVANLNPERFIRAPIPGKLGSVPCGTLVSIDCLRDLYNFSAGTTAAAGNQLGIGEWADYLVESDLPIFFKNWTDPEIPSDVKPEFIPIDGGLTSNASTIAQFSGVESALDFQTAYSIIYPQVWSRRLSMLKHAEHISHTGHTFVPGRRRCQRRQRRHVQHLPRRTGRVLLHVRRRRPTLRRSRVSRSKSGWLHRPLAMWRRSHFERILLLLRAD